MVQYLSKTHLCTTTELGQRIRPTIAPRYLNSKWSGSFPPASTGLDDSCHQPVISEALHLCHSMGGFQHWRGTLLTALGWALVQYFWLHRFISSYPSTCTCLCLPNLNFFAAKRHHIENEHLRFPHHVHGEHRESFSTAGTQGGQLSVFFAGMDQQAMGGSGICIHPCMAAGVGVHLASHHKYPM